MEYMGLANKIKITCVYKIKESGLVAWCPVEISVKAYQQVVAAPAGA